MPRPLNAAFATELEKRQITLVVFGEAEYEDGTTRQWSGPGPFSWDGKVWAGGSDLIEISPIIETAEARANGIRITQSGIPDMTRARALADQYQGRRLRLWQGAIGANGQLIGQPALVFSGIMDQGDIQDDGEEATVVWTAESLLIDQRRSWGSLYDDEYHRRTVDSEDGFFRFAADMATRQVMWPGPGWVK